MPKMKTDKGVAKRFKKTANGFKRKQAHLRHILTKKTSKRKRHLKKSAKMYEAFAKLYKRLARVA